MQTIGGVGNLVGGADDGDALVPLLDQMSGRQPGAVAIVERHAARFKPRQRAVDEHHARDLLHPAAKFLIAQPFGVHHQRFAAVPHQLFNRLTLFFGVVVTVANQQKIVGGVGHLLDRLDHRAEEGIGNVGDDQPQRLGGLLRQRSCVGVRVILQLFHGGLHRGARPFAGLGGIVYHAGYRGHGNTRQPGNILYRSHISQHILGNRLHPPVLRKKTGAASGLVRNLWRRLQNLFESVRITDCYRTIAQFVRWHWRRAEVTSVHSDLRRERHVH
ncbi:Uncharacterised protein [Acinetobacter baumannii]|nr:Uncharacterised protein [Acinetobacter baumannii]